MIEGEFTGTFEEFFKHLRKRGVDVDPKAREEVKDGLAAAFKATVEEKGEGKEEKTPG